MPHWRWWLLPVRGKRWGMMRPGLIRSTISSVVNKASVKVVATDGFGNRYECTDVIEQDCWYPSYMKYGNI